eukprot:201468-Chlamydomonas_euryale.AAC.2
MFACAQANRQTLVKQTADAEASAAALRAADQRILQSLDGHGYEFSLSVRPPTPALNKLTEYLQVGTVCVRVFVRVRVRERVCVCVRAEGADLSPERRGLASPFSKPEQSPL